MDPVDAQKLIVHRLNDRCRSQARDAIQGYRTNAPSSAERFYLAAGSALESAIKARLCSVSPFLLAPDENGWWKHAKAFYAHSASLPKGTKSVSFSDGYQRLQDLDAHVGAVKSGVEAIQTRRNAAAHIGLTTVVNRHELTTHAAQFAEALELIACVTDRSEFWAGESGVVEQLISDRRNELALRVQARMARAREHIEELTPQQRQLLDDAAQEDVEAKQDWDHVEVPCPVCDTPGWAIGRTRDDGDVDFDYSDGESTAYWAPDIKTTIDTFLCLVCGLELSSPEECKAAGMPEDSPNWHVDASEFAVADHDWDRD